MFGAESRFCRLTRFAGHLSRGKDERKIADTSGWCAAQMRWRWECRCESDRHLRVEILRSPDLELKGIGRFNAVRGGHVLRLTIKIVVRKDVWNRVACRAAY